MATITGSVIFDRDRSATISAGDSGIANIPVVLQNIATNVRLGVLTDSAGNYSFFNVPAGNYRIVESFGFLGAVPTPGNFSTATVGSIPPGVNPPISFATNPPPGSTNLDSVTPDTLIVTVNGADLTNENFLNGPVIYTPIQTILDPCTVVSNVNLITAADNGTFGFFPQGTPANTGAPVEPYPGVTPDFTYVLPNPATFTPFDGEYTVQNIMNDAMSNTIGAWWRIADHTTGNETGRMMVVNGFEPGSIFFRSVVTVMPNTNYLFSAWILNLFKVEGYPNPALGVRILDSLGNILYNATLGAQIPVNVNAPEWKQIGSVINSRNNTSLTVEFISEGVAAIGNDYAIDDVQLDEIFVPEFIPVKTANKSTVNLGETVQYTVTLENTCTSPLTDVLFHDLVPNGLTFVPGTVTVNGISNPSANPNTGFTLPDVPGGETVTVTFDATASSIPPVNPTINSATITYTYSPVEGGIGGVFNVTSNEVTVLVAESADVFVIKTATPNPVNPGEQLTFEIVVGNAGPSAANNVVLTDIVPAILTGVEFSLNGGVTFNPWPGSFDFGTLPNGVTHDVLIRGTVPVNASGTITNTATVTSTTPDPNPANNTSTVIVEITTAAEADIFVVKTATPNPVSPGEQLTFEIIVGSAGPSAAENVVLTDIVPAILTGVEFSLNGGVTFNPWPGSFNFGTLPDGASHVVLIRGTVPAIASGTIMNTATVTSTTPDPDPTNNTSTVIVEISPAIEADVFVVKTATPNPVVPGEQLTFEIVVGNAGPAAADNVVLTDHVPSILTGVEFSLNGGVTFNPWPGSFDFGTLPDGATRVVLIRGTVPANASGTITNTATVTSTTPDPNPANNTSTVTVEICGPRCHAITDVIESVALQEAALSHLLNAEGEKLQAVIAMEGLTAEELLEFNQSATKLIGAITRLETILLGKLQDLTNLNT